MYHINRYRSYVKNFPRIVQSIFTGVFFLASVCLYSVSPGWTQEEESSGWPREISTPGGIVVLYQPQPDNLDGNQLDGRMAVALEIEGSTEPVFGAVWFQATLETDRDARTATITGVSIKRVRFPEEDEQKAKKLKTLLEKEIPKWELPISMDRLLVSLELAEKRSDAATKINTDPGKIIFVTEPAILVSIDGEPKLKQEENSGIMRVVNTPFTILLATSDKTYYLYADVDTWYAANDIKGEWSIAENVPQEIAHRAPKEDIDTEEKVDSEDPEEPGPPPKVIVATQPTELISTTGEPEYTPITGTELMYMSNTESDVLLHITSQQYYVLIAGRWYVSASLEGPWRYMPGKELPKDFAQIPEESEIGTVLYAVPGTDAAMDAVGDAQIPQTAAIDPRKATLSVEYDGDPKFDPIDTTQMFYAVNTATPVIEVKDKYYACDQAVWFAADKPLGPWRVARSIPDEIYTIPPECPIYHVTFVRIYEATDDVVYVGYTPGYTHTYVYHTTIVYGTGYWWPGWYGHWYYPRPTTWGFHVRYNPWTGWRFGFSYSTGPFRFTIGGGGWYRGGWWGPGRYRGYRRGYRHGYRQGSRAGYRSGYQTGRRKAAQENLYRNQSNQKRVAAQTDAGKKRAKATTADKRPNNVYTDKNGDIHRKTDQGWENRTKDGWKSSEGESKKKQQQIKTGDKSGKNNRSGQLEQNHKARQRGDQRTQNFKKGNRSSGKSRGSGGRSGGGSRR
jgi:hypothetical protein